MQHYMAFRLPILYLQTILATGIFAFPLKRHSHPAARFALLAAVGCALSYIDAHLLYFPETGLENSLPRFFCMTIFYLLTVASAFCYYDANIWTAMFVASAGYAAQNIAGSLRALTGLVVGPSLPMFIIFDTLGYAAVYLVLFLVFRKSITQGEFMFDSRTKALFSFVIMILCIGMARITQDNIGRNLVSQVAEWIYAVISALLILIVQFGVMENRLLKRNMDMMRELMREQRVEYAKSKESIDLINEKYHDLKKLLAAFQGMLPDAQISGIMQKISDYDILFHTGNEVLDVVLSEKNALCRQRGIDFTCTVEHGDLSFVEELDLYTLLENAISNAIEAVEQLPAEQRYICASISADGGLAMLHVENPCAREPVLEHGLPKTDKDENDHGFGLRSMERTAQKYDGSVGMKARNNVFFLDIILFAFSQQGDGHRE